MFAIVTVTYSFIVLGDTIYISWFILHQLIFFQIDDRKKLHSEMYHYIPQFSDVRSHFQAAILVKHQVLMFAHNFVIIFLKNYTKFSQ